MKTQILNVQKYSTYEEDRKLYTDEQAMLLCTLNYYNINLVAGEKSLGEQLESILSDPDMVKKIKRQSMAGTGKEERIDILHAIVDDPELSRLRIVDNTTDKDIAAHGLNAISYYDPVDNQAMITYRGTSELEWIDNAYGLAGLESPGQLHARAYYYDISSKLSAQYPDVVFDVSGHSKGANKAMDVAIMFDEVRTCYSFDGQGFSDKYMEVNADKIARNSDKIVRHACNLDPVHALGFQANNDIAYHEFDKGNLLKQLGNKINPISGLVNAGLAHAPNSMYSIQEVNGKKNCVFNQQAEPAEYVGFISDKSKDMIINNEIDAFESIMSSIQMVVSQTKREPFEKQFMSRGELVSGVQGGVKSIMDDDGIKEKLLSITAGEAVKGLDSVTLFKMKLRGELISDKHFESVKQMQIGENTYEIFQDKNDPSKTFVGIRLDENEVIFIPQGDEKNKFQTLEQSQKQLQNINQEFINTKQRYENFSSEKMKLSNQLFENQGIDSISRYAESLKPTAIAGNGDKVMEHTVCAVR